MLEIGISKGMATHILVIIFMTLYLILIGNTMSLLQQIITTGSIELGDNSNEIIIKYCESCHSVIYNLNENGEEEWSDNYRGNIGWTLTDIIFLK